MLEFEVGVRHKERVDLPSSNTGDFVVLVIVATLFLMAASVGGGHLCVLMASTRMIWSGRSVFIFNFSPGRIIFLALIDTSGATGWTDWLMLAG